MKTRLALYIVAALALLFLVNTYRASIVSDIPRPEETTAEVSIFDVPITVDPVGPSFVIDSRRLTAPQGIPNSETNVFALVFDDDGRLDHLTTEPDIPTFTKKNRGRVVVGVAKSEHDPELAYFFGRLASGGASVVRRQLTKTEMLSPPLFRGLRRQSAATEADDLNPKVSIGRVAHAGGDLKGRAYTNSYEALEESYSEGFRYFEIDFNFTADNQLVCIHDWDVTWPSMFDGDSTRTPTLQEFIARSEKLSGVTPCTLDGLSLWMLSHPDAVLITDVKGIELVHAAIPDSTQRVIPQSMGPFVSLVSRRSCSPCTGTPAPNQTCCMTFADGKETSA